MSEWTSRLRQASFRGVPMGVLSNEAIVGRRLSVHEYPDRDDPFVEDLGRSTRRLSFRGFLLENSAVYHGGPVDQQAAAMSAAAEAEGIGELVHPTRGRLLVSVERLNVSERWDAGRYIELGFELIIGGPMLFGIAGLSTVADVLAAADAAASFFSLLFGGDADSYVGLASVPGDVATAAASFSAQALGLAGGGYFDLNGSAGSSAITSAVSTFRAASSGLGLVTGAGASTATAVTGVVRAIGGSSAAGTAVQSLSDFAGDIFG